MTVRIAPAPDLASVQALVAAYWTPGHPVGRQDSPLARFYLTTPWVDRAAFPAGVSALVAYGNDGAHVGMNCVLVTPDVAWHVIWTVAPEGRGQGVGRRLLLAMREAVAPRPLHVFGISSDGLPHYRATQFQIGQALRWQLTSRRPYVNGARSLPLDAAWRAYRFTRHPVFRYEERGDTIVRSDLNNAWGRVAHVVHVGADWPEALRTLTDTHDLVQAWAYRSPGEGWELPPATVPTRFHPVAATGNTLGVAGWPGLPSEVHGGDGMQDRPT